MKKIKYLLLVLVFASTLVSCSKNDNAEQVVTVTNRTAADLWDVYVQFDVDEKIQSGKILAKGESSQKISVPDEALSVQVIFSLHEKGWGYGRIKDRFETESFDLRNGETIIQLKNDSDCRTTYDDRE